MTETRQTALFSLFLLTFIAALGALAVGLKTLDQYRTDNQTISTLRAQIVELKRDMHETEVSLDNQALEANHLGLENEVLKARVETAEKRGKL